MKYKDRYKNIPIRAKEIALWISEGACNSFAIINGLNDVRTLLKEDFHKKGTDWFNQHPCVVVIVEQLSCLSLLNRGNEEISRYDSAMDCLKED